MCVSESSVCVCRASPLLYCGVYVCVSHPSLYYRRHRAVLGQLVDVLVNSVDTLPLMELIQPIQAQLLTTPNKTFRREVQQCYKS